MTWQFPALLTAVGFALKGFSVKCACRKAEAAGPSAELGVMAWVTSASALLLACVWIIRGCPLDISDGAGFAQVFSAGVMGGACASVFYYKAIQHAPLSMVMPVLSLSPVLMILTSRWMLNETTGPAGIAGILAISSGLVMLYAGGRQAGSDWPRQRRGLGFAVLTAVIWSITANIDKRATTLSNPFFYPMAIQTVLAVLFFAVLLWRQPHELRNTIRAPDVGRWIFAAAASDTLVLVSQMTAILMTHVAYVIAIKRSGALLAVLLGWAFLGEKQPLLRLMAALLIVGGVAILVSLS